MRRLMVLSGVLLITACSGSADETTSSGATGGSEEPGGESCEGYSLGDACIDDDNFAQCQQMAASCPGEVSVMESCPLQFACPGRGESPGGDTPESSTCSGHTADEQCMNADNFARCQEAEAQCPGEVIEAESCPLQFSCP